MLLYLIKLNHSRGKGIFYQELRKIIIEMLSLISEVYN